MPLPENITSAVPPGHPGGSGHGCGGWGEYALNSFCAIFGRWMDRSTPTEACPVLAAFLFQTPGLTLLCLWPALGRFGCSLSVRFVWDRGHSWSSTINRAILLFYPSNFSAHRRSARTRSDADVIFSEETNDRCVSRRDRSTGTRSPTKRTQKPSCKAADLPALRFRCLSVSLRYRWPGLRG